MANGEETPKAEAPKSKSRLIIWLCVLVAFIAIFGVFAKTMFFPQKSDSTTGSNEVTPVPVEPGPIVEVGEFLTNLAKPDEDAYISVKVAVELDAKPDSEEATLLMEEMTAREIEFRSVIEEVLRTRNREMLSGESGVDGMRKEIYRKINSLLQKGQIRKVLTYNLLIS